MEQESSIVAGVDIGAATAKAVILRNGDVLSCAIIPTGHSVVRATGAVIEEALQKSGLSMDQVKYVISTGYGRRAVPFANKVLTEIICHAVGVNSMMPNARTIIDIGGQDSKVIGLDDSGNVGNFVMNDKCAAGTGRFLEVMAGVLDVELSEMGSISLLSKAPCRITSTCTVFAESEVVSLRADGRSRGDVLAGIHRAVALRVVIMGRSVGFRDEVVFTGGVAKNVAVKRALEDEIGVKILVPEEPQIIGALGAAVLAKIDLATLPKVREAS